MIALALRLPLEPVLAGSLPFILAFPAVTIAGVWGGKLAAAMTVLVDGGYFLGSWLFLGLGLGTVALPFFLFLLSSLLITLVASELRAAVAELRGQESARHQSDRHLRLVVRELEHRVKNSLALVGALIKLTARHSTDIADFRQRFEPRLQALAQAQTLLTHSEWQAPTLESLVEETLSPFLRTKDPELAIIRGAPFAVPVAAAVSLMLVLHELATNALKHGGLSQPGGCVRLEWRVVEDGEVACIEWIETGVPLVLHTDYKGFGTDLFRALDGAALRIQRRFEPEGVTCRIEISREQGGSS